MRKQENKQIDRQKLWKSDKHIDIKKGKSRNRKKIKTTNIKYKQTKLNFKGYFNFQTFVENYILNHIIAIL